jgi:hypothetical protein
VTVAHVNTLNAESGWQFLEEMLMVYVTMNYKGIGK